GIVVGPIGLGFVGAAGDQQSVEQIAQLAELGLTFLMFIVGLEIDVKKLVQGSRQASAVTVVQVVGAVLLGWLAALALGFRSLEAVYLGIAVAFSSTMIVVKLLSDRGELDTLPGRTTMGVLLLQDVLAIVVLAIQPTLGGGTQGAAAAGSLPPAVQMALAAIKGLLLVAVAVGVSRYVLPVLFRWVAMLPEIMLLSAVTWCFLVCYVAVRLGFSPAMGALIAGASISAYPYTLDVVAKIRGLRDFFVTLFFVSLGMLLADPSSPGAAGGERVLAWLKLGGMGLLLAAVVVLARFATVWPMVRALKYDNRVGMLSSLHLSQISEFALVVVILGGPTGALRHVGSEVVSLVVVLMIVTATASTYLIQGSHAMTRLVVRHTRDTPLCDRVSADDQDRGAVAAPIMLIGCFRLGSSLVHELLKSGRRFSVIDFNPELRDRLHRLNVPCLYGDISHLDTLCHAGVDQADVLVLPVPDDFLRGTDNVRLMACCRRTNPRARIVVIAESIRHALSLYEQGADYVIVPRTLAAAEVASVIGRFSQADFAQWRQRQIDDLKSRTEVIA
ncbi:MAG TPA: cation:proton antiporter, partial [Phycisphaerae bacterium]|nr:cation:proton antiporter [Phycisphaerae bacterium]